LANEIGRLTILFRAFRDVAWDHDQARRDYRRLAEEAREHLAIVDALAEGDRRAASRAMSRHIRSGMKYWTRAFTDRDAIASANGNGKTGPASNAHSRNGNGRTKVEY
jgi:DNA-binding FadR family transcriptional regulator